MTRTWSHADCSSSWSGWMVLNGESVQQPLIKMFPQMLIWAQVWIIGTVGGSTLKTWYALSTNVEHWWAMFLQHDSTCLLTLSMYRQCVNNVLAWNNFVLLKTEDWLHFFCGFVFVIVILRWNYELLLPNSNRIQIYGCVVMFCRMSFCFMLAWSDLLSLDGRRAWMTSRLAKLNHLWFIYCKIILGEPWPFLGSEISSMVKRGNSDCVHDSYTITFMKVTQLSDLCFPERGKSICFRGRGHFLFFGWHEPINA